MEGSEGKYVVVLAHNDMWGALNANQIIKGIKEYDPEMGIHLIVSKPTRDEEGREKTKLDDLRLGRKLKGDDFNAYLEVIDEMYERGEVETPPKNLTFKQLADQYCIDGNVHYTSAGGSKGGQDVGRFIEEIEQMHDGQGPEMLLSVDTMAFVPKDVLKKYDSISTHPGPLDEVRIRGMQGTLRALVNGLYYRKQGEEMMPDFHTGRYFGRPKVKGTLFLQVPELDKGPIISTVTSPAAINMSSYEVRDGLYYCMIEEMLAYLPELLDKEKRKNLIEHAKEEKLELDARGFQNIGALGEEPLDNWQGDGVLSFMQDVSGETRFEMYQNKIVDPSYVQSCAAEFFPNESSVSGEFLDIYSDIFGDTAQAIEQQRIEHLSPVDYVISGGGQHAGMLYEGYQVVRRKNGETWYDATGREVYNLETNFDGSNRKLNGDNFSR